MEHTSHELLEMHVIVKGNVQGVGFRALTRYHANDLGLKGTIHLNAEPLGPHLKKMINLAQMTLISLYLSYVKL